MLLSWTRRLPRTVLNLLVMVDPPHSAAMWAIEFRGLASPVASVPAMSALVTKKEGLLHLSVQDAGVSEYLLPKGDDIFESLDGAMQIQFHKEEGKFVGLSAEVRGTKVTGQKQEGGNP